LPAWFAVAQHDEVSPPDAERQFVQGMSVTTVEVDSSHAALISHPDEGRPLRSSVRTPGDHLTRTDDDD